MFTFNLFIIILAMSPMITALIITSWKNQDLPEKFWDIAVIIWMTGLLLSTLSGLHELGH